MKPALIVLAAHEPLLDPRVDWGARLASHSRPVTVYGLDWGMTRKSLAPTYQTVRAKPHGISWDFFSRGLVFFFGWNLFWAIPVFLILFPVVAFLVVVRLLVGRILAMVQRMPSLWKLFRNWGRAGSQWRVVAPFSEIRQFAYLIRHFLTSGSALLKGVEANLQPGSRPILHANDLDALVPAVLIKLRHGGSVIYDAHEFYPVQFVDPSKWFVWCFKWIERKCIAHCGEVFSVTPQLAQAMADTYSSPKPYGYVPNASPIDPGPLPLIKTDLPLKFIFQGNFTRGRGLSQLVRFWNQINTHGAHLYLRGPDSALKLELIEDARRHGTLDKSVFFLTPVQELDLISSLEGFDVGVIPYEPVSINNRYCCPNKLSQYMQAGLAILCNDLEFVKSVVNKYGCGKSYDATDRQTFEEAVRWWSAHPEELHKMKERGRAAALKEYNWETEGQKFVEAYDRVSMSSSS